MTKDRPKKRWGVIVILVIILAMIVSAGFLLFGGKSNVQQSDGFNSTYEYSTLICSTTENPGLGISADLHNPVEMKQEIRANFGVSNKLSTLYETLTAGYATTEEAEGAVAAIHADYNNYMGRYDTDPGTFFPTYNAIDGKAKISHYAEKSKLWTKLNRVFLLPEDTDYSLDSIKTHFVSHNFECNTEVKTKQE